MIEAGDRTQAHVVDGRILYLVVEGTAFLNGARTTLRHCQRAADRLDLPGPAARTFSEPQRAVAHFLVLHSIELFYKALSVGTGGSIKKTHVLRPLHDSLALPVKQYLELGFGEIAARSRFAVGAVATWVGEEQPERQKTPETRDGLTAHLDFLDDIGWHHYKYADERFSDESRRRWGYYYRTLDGWIEFSRLIRDRVLDEAIREGAFAVTHDAMSSGFVLSADFLKVLDQV